MTEHRETQVAVVGAGFAGLAAARHLADAGASAVVVEARDRVGGRVLNHPVEGGWNLEVGGQWLGPTQDRMYGLCKELDVEWYPTHTDGDAVLLLDGKEHRYAGGLPRLNPLVLADYGLAQQRFDKLAAKVPLDAPWEAPGAEKLDGMTVETWMRRAIRTRSARDVFALGFGAVFATEPATVSMLHALFYVHAGGNLDRLLSTRNGAQQDRLVGGTQRLAQRLADALPEGTVELGAPVRRIAQDAGGVTVETARGLTVRAQRVIVAVPPAVSTAIEFDPPLPAARAQLGHRMPHGSVIKCMAVYDEPWWRRDGFSGEGADTDGPVTVTFDNTPYDPANPGTPPGVLLGFLEGDHARRLSAVPEEERRRAVLGSFVKLFGPKAADAVSYFDLDWSAEPYTRGCYGAHMPPGVLTRYGPALRDPVGRLHWAGTETATTWAGYMDGAVESGERAAREALHAAE